MTAASKAPPGEVRPPVDESGGREDERLAGGKSVALTLPRPADTTAEPRCAMCPLAHCHSFCRGLVDQPRRVKVIGDLWHGRVPDGAVYVGRAAPGLKRSQYANPHPVGKPCRRCGGRVHSRAESIARYRWDLHTTPGLLDQARRELAGRDLACWCPLDEDCHADVLLAAVNGGGGRG